MGVWARLAWGSGVLVTGAFLGPRGLSLLPLAILCLACGAGGHQQPPGEVGFEGFEGMDEVGDYDEYEDEYVVEGEELEQDYEVDYEYVDLQKDSDGDGLRTLTGLPMTRCNEMSRTE